MEAAADMLQYMKDEHVRVFVVLLPEDLMPAFLKAASALDMLGIGYSYITVDAAGGAPSHL